MTADSPPGGQERGPQRRLRLFPTSPTRIGSVDRITSLLWKVDSSSIAIKRAPTPPPGYRLIDAFAIAPDARRPRYLLPLASRRVAAKAVSSYGSLRSGTRRVAGSIAATGLRIGLAQHLLRDRIYVYAAPHIPDPELHRVSLLHHLAQVLGREHVTGLVGLGGSGPYAKPVIQVLSTEGQVVGFVKVGWDDLTAKLVENEARALQVCAEGHLRTVRMPSMIHSGSWNGLALSLTSPLPDGVGRYPGMRLPSLDVTKEICSLTWISAQSFWESPFASRLQKRAEEAKEGSVGSGTQLRALSWIRGRFPDAQLPIGMWHGDWVPWNLATYNRELHAWDWEYSTDAAPLGFDVLHFYFHSTLIGQGKELADAITRARAASDAPLERLDITGSFKDLLLGLYLIEASFRAEDVLHHGGTPNPRIYPGIVAALEELPRMIRGTPSS